MATSSRAYNTHVTSTTGSDTVRANSSITARPPFISAAPRPQRVSPSRRDPVVSPGTVSV